jgi:F0F1-type ATP synthase assembly protein I
MARAMRFDYRRHRPWLEDASILLQIGLTMVGCIGFCLYLGLQLDRWLETRGLFSAIMTVLGVVGGAVTVLRQIRALLEPKRKRDDEGEEPP